MEICGSKEGLFVADGREGLLTREVELDDTCSDGRVELSWMGWTKPARFGSSNRSDSSED